MKFILSILGIGFCLYLLGKIPHIWIAVAIVLVVIVVMDYRKRSNL